MHAACFFIFWWPVLRCGCRVERYRVILVEPIPALKRFCTEGIIYSPYRHDKFGALNVYLNGSNSERRQFVDFADDVG